MDPAVLVRAGIPARRQASRTEISHEVNPAQRAWRDCNVVSYTNSMTG